MIGKTEAVRITAKVDYGIRALLELALRPNDWTKGEVLAAAQSLPLHFAENILRQLRNGGFVEAHRGADGGYRLALPASAIRIGDVIRTLEGPLAAVQGVRPDQLNYEGAAKHMQQVWISVRTQLRSVLDEISIQDVVNGDVPEVADEEWAPRVREP